MVALHLRCEQHEDRYIAGLSVTLTDWSLPSIARALEDIQQGALQLQSILAQEARAAGTDERPPPKAGRSPATVHILRPVPDPTPAS